ncbi:MAG TPA: glycosyltransferase family 39 protein, partial [Candidatus Limnocylindria bacterium]|nr:glycosyltransferase family 39 protein [Candidatus Limnocylindria bacterium]
TLAFTISVLALAAAPAGASTRADFRTAAVTALCALGGTAAADLVSGARGLGPVQGALLIGAGVCVGLVGAWGVGLSGARPLVTRLGGPHTLRAGGVPIAELAALAAIVAAFATFAVRHLLIDSSFGWDESVYALTSRHWVFGTPSTGWAAHRPPGMSALGAVSILFSEDEVAFRAWGVLFGIGGIVAGWLVARSIGGGVAGLVAAAGIGSVWRFQADAARFLTDVPATALLLLLTWWLWRASRAAELPRAFLIVAPLVAVSFYVRYGAAVPLVFLGITALIVSWRTYVRSWRTVLATLAAAGVMLLGHVVPAIRMTGSPWGVALGARDLAAPTHPGAALESYLAGLPDHRLAGTAAAVLMVLGVIGWLVALLSAMARRRSTPLAAGMTLLCLPALAVFLVLGWVALPQVRYIFFSIAALICAGGVAVAMALRWAPHRWRTALGAAAVTISAVAMVDQGLLSVAIGAADAPGRDDVRRAGLAIRADADGRPCAALTHIPPIITWYSGCASHAFGRPAQPGREAALEGVSRGYLVLYQGGPGSSLPFGAVREGYIALADEEPVAVIRDLSSGRIDVTVYRLREPDTGASFVPRGGRRGPGG